MRIAYVVPYVPNLIRTRPYNLITQLVKLGNEVTVFTLGSGEHDQKDAENLRERVAHVNYIQHPVWYSLWNSVQALPSRRPLQSVFSWNPQLAIHLDKLINQGLYDVIHVEHLRGSRYGQYIKSRSVNVPVVWDSVDCISYLFEQASKYGTGGFGKFVTRFELGRTRQMESRLICEFDHVLVTSEADKEFLLEMALPESKPAPISVLSNGVDLEYFHPNPGIQRDEDTLVFSGKMSYHANISMVKYFVSEILPMVWKKRPSVQLVIVGKDPTADIVALSGDSRVTVTGTVDDIRPFLWRATMAVVPLVYGAGIQNKLLEAMACGIPVITTSKTLASFQGDVGRDFLVADGAKEFSNRILDLLDDKMLQSKIGFSGAKYVKHHHNWRAITKKLMTYYVNTIEAVKIAENKDIL